MKYHASMQTRPVITPGTTPPMNILVTDAPLSTPKMTMGRDGGMMGPVMEPAHTQAVESDASYPSLIMIGSMIPPIAEIVTTAAPVRAAKIMHARMAA